MNSPQVVVKLVIFTIFDGVLTMYLPDKKLPQKNVFSLSQLDIIAGQMSERAIDSTLQTCYLEQLYTFSPSKKEERIIISYFLLVRSSSIKKDVSSCFIPIHKSDRFSDSSIIKYALQRLRWKIEYTNVVYSLLPHEFTLTELQEVYEAIRGNSIDKRNFRKKIFSLGILKPSGKKRTGVKARPAKMYEFKTRKPVMVKVFS